jgi:integrase
MAQAAGSTRAGKHHLPDRAKVGAGGTAIAGETKPGAQQHSGRITYLTVDQIERLLKAAEGDQNRQIYPFIRIGLETSMRKSEILGIRREHIDTERMVIYIPKAKAGAREQPITKGLADYLESYVATLQKGTNSGYFRQSPPWRGARSIWTNRFAAA